MAPVMQANLQRLSTHKLHSVNIKPKTTSFSSQGIIVKTLFTNFHDYHVIIHEVVCVFVASVLQAYQQRLPTYEAHEWPDVQ